MQNKKRNQSLESPNRIEYKLDTAGKFFSFVSSPKVPCVYRFWVTLGDFVDVTILQQALERVITRFPYFYVELKKGYSWFYWQQSSIPLKVQHEREYPCQYIPIREPHKLPFRVIATEKEIIVEFNHTLTDGYGAMTFLKTLVCEYYRLNGYQFDNLESDFTLEQKPQEEELEYSHRKHYKLGIPKLDKNFRAFHLPYERINNGVFYTTNGQMNVNDILNVSRQYNVTLTEFLAAIYIDTFQEILFSFPEQKQKRLMKPIRIMIPINVRNLLSSQTMWNFTAYVAPGIDPRLGEYSFDEIINQVHHYKNLQMNEKYIIQQLTNFVTLEKNPILITSPRFLKRLFITPIYKNVAEAIFSACMTNLGKTAFQQPLNNEVKNFQVLPMNHPFFKTACALLTYNNILNIDFGRNYREPIVEKKFFSKLNEFDIQVQVTEKNIF